MKTLAERAIDAGIDGDWEKAIQLNKELIKLKKNDIDALNRLSFAYLQNNKKTLARKIINKVLRVDKFNSIANKNLRLLNICNSYLKKDFSLLVKNVDFIEEPGTKKIISLINQCTKEILYKIRPGTKLNLKIRRRRVCVQLESMYIGGFPDDINKNLIKLIENGNKYEIFFKSFDQKKAYILLQEFRRQDK